MMSPWDSASPTSPVELRSSPATTTPTSPRTPPVRSAPTRWRHSARPDLLAELSAALDESSVTGLLADVVLGPPVPRPQKSFAIGLNYRAHAAEGGMEVPESPLVFTKFPSCIVGPTADVELRSDGCDYEGELLVVIGTGGKDIAVADAWDHVVGLTVGQDISDRPVQFAAKPPHFDLGKSFDTFGPTGPVLVSIDEVADRDDLHIRCCGQRRGPPGRHDRQPDLRRPDADQLPVAHHDARHR